MLHLIKYLLIGAAIFTLSVLISVITFYVTGVYGYITTPVIHLILVYTLFKLDII